LFRSNVKPTVTYLLLNIYGCFPEIWQHLGVVPDSFSLDRHLTHTHEKLWARDTHSLDRIERIDGQVAIVTIIPPLSSLCQQAHTTYLCAGPTLFGELFAIHRTTPL